MVALKRPQAVESPAPGSRKQERRGGIETSSPPPGGPSTSRKQERRGGIETCSPDPDRVFA